MDPSTVTSFIVVSEKVGACLDPSVDQEHGSSEKRVCIECKQGLVRRSTP